MLTSFISETRSAMVINFFRYYLVMVLYFHLGVLCSKSFCIPPRLKDDTKRKVTHLKSPHRIFFPELPHHMPQPKNFSDLQGNFPRMNYLLPNRQTSTPVKVAKMLILGKLVFKELYKKTFIPRPCCSQAEPLKK